MKEYRKGLRKLALVCLCLIVVISAVGVLTTPIAATKETQTGGRLLYAGGIPFGVKFFSTGVVIAGFCDIPTSAGGEKNPALDAGLMKNDVILSVDGVEPESCEDFLSMINNCGGKQVTIVYERDNKTETTHLTPIYSEPEGRYKCGIYIRQGGAGIGTVTYIDPDSLSFGGLGHGICDSDNGKLLPIKHGVTMNVGISGIVKGKAGSPGEIKGSFASGKTGIVYSNTSCGVFGVFSAIPEGVELKKYPIATRNEVREGKAYILCTLDGSGKPQKYEIEISAIKKDCTSDDNKCFTIKVTDDRLIDKTGGIIQGMSGSTIIQGCKIIGAVTHVMISDPTIGYGIFIENMLANSAR